MSIDLQITSREFELTEAIESFIRKRTDKLEKFFDRVMSVSVVLESPPKHSQKGSRYNVRLDITVPGPDIVIKRQENEDIYVALRDAFNAAERLIEDFARKRRGDVKSHEAPPEAVVKTLISPEEYGFLETAEGTEIYFHRSSVVADGFGKLHVGDKVRYTAVQGEQGLRASTVEPIA